MPIFSEWAIIKSEGKDGVTRYGRIALGPIDRIVSRPPEVPQSHPTPQVPAKVKAA